MLVGFNHNIMYRGGVFHVQTEDSGVDNPHIVTLLYQGGVIICSTKTSYSDIVRMDNLAQVVEELMKEQHKQMMRRLKGGEFDERLFPGENGADASAPPEQQAAVSGEPAVIAASREESPAEAAPEQKQKEEVGETSLDDAILAFFGVEN